MHAWRAHDGALQRDSDLLLRQAIHLGGVWLHLTKHHAHEHQHAALENMHKA